LTEDNNGINTDDDKVNDHENENTFNPSATEFASIDEQPILLRIFMIQEIGIVLITKLEMY
jgi:hypothetical protein